MPPVEPTLSVKVVLNISAGITVMAAFRFHLPPAQGSFVGLDISMHGSGVAQMRPRRHSSNQSLPIVGSSAENLRVSDPTWIESVKVQTVFFFSQLIAVLTPAVFCYLQSYAFIP